MRRSISTGRILSTNRHLAYAKLFRDIKEFDAIDERLKDAIVGRCGYMASVVQSGVLSPAMGIEIEV